jgi:hypothetical protein
MRKPPAVFYPHKEEDFILKDTGSRIESGINLIRPIFGLQDGVFLISTKKSFFPVFRGKVIRFFGGHLVLLSSLISFIIK